MNPDQKDSESSQVQTKVSFTIFVNIFLSLTVKSGLDNLLKLYGELSSSYQVRGFWREAAAHDYYFVQLAYLATLIVIVLQSFVLFLKVASHETYSHVLSEGPRRLVRALFTVMVIVFAIIYLLGSFFTKDSREFFYTAWVLTIFWLIFDLFCRAVIREYYKLKDKIDNVNEDLLYHAVCLWIIWDSVLIVTNGVVGWFLLDQHLYVCVSIMFWSLTIASVFVVWLVRLKESPPPLTIIAPLTG